MKFNNVSCHWLYCMWSHTQTPNVEVFVPKAPAPCVTYWCIVQQNAASLWSYKQFGVTSQPPYCTNVWAYKQYFNIYFQDCSILLPFSTLPTLNLPDITSKFRPSRYSTPNQNYTYNYTESLSVPHFTALVLKQGSPNFSWQRTTPIIVGRLAGRTRKCKVGLTNMRPPVTWIF
jgi:hypothetical protein